MKQLLTVIILLFSLQSFAQDTTYNDQIRFALPDSIEDNITFKRRAAFEAMIYNQRTKQISLQFVIKFSGATRELKSVQSYSKEIVISNNEYVVSETGVYVGSISQVLALYGTPDSTGYVKLPNGLYQLSTPCMGYYDYLIKGFDTNQKLQAIIRAIGIKAGQDGKLN